MGAARNCCVGALVGAASAAWFTSHRERESRRQARRAEAYVELVMYIDRRFAIASWKAPHDVDWPDPPSEDPDADRRTNALIAAYASDEVRKKVAAWAELIRRLDELADQYPRERWHDIVETSTKHAARLAAFRIRTRAGPARRAIVEQIRRELKTACRRRRNGLRSLARYRPGARATRS